MEYFPFYMDVTGRTFLVVGGGALAYHKITVLSQYEIKIKVVAKELGASLTDYINQHNEQISYVVREYRDKDLENADYVIVATTDQGLNHWIAKCCKDRKIPVNVVDGREDSSFIMPAIIHGEVLDIAISSGGESPAAVSYLKRVIQGHIPDRFEELVKTLGTYRPYIKEKIIEQSIRSEAFQCLLSIGLVNDGVLTEEIVKDVVRHLTNEIQEI